MRRTVSCGRGLIAGLLLMFTSGQVSAAGPATLVPGSLSVCLFATIPPFTSKSASGAWEGWDIDYVKAFAAKLGLEFRPVEVADYNGFWNRPGADACDLAASGIADLPDRRRATGQAGIWSGHYYFAQRAFGVRKEDAGKLTGSRDLEGKTVLVVEGSTADVDLRSRIDLSHVPGVTIIATSDHVENAQRVRDGKAQEVNINGRADDTQDQGRQRENPGENEPFAFGSSLATVQVLAGKMGLVPVWPHCLMLPDGQVRDEPFSFVVRAKSQGLVEALNAFIAATPYAGGRGTDACPSGAR